MSIHSLKFSKNHIKSQSTNNHHKIRRLCSFINKIRNRTSPNTQYQHSTMNELASIISALCPFKAPGNDGIQNILLKNVPSDAIEFMSKIFNCCLRWSYSPSAFRTAKIVPITKAGKDKMQAINYRSISLLNAISKLFEKVILIRINEFTTDRKIIKPDQFGFRTQHSTTHQIERIFIYIKNKKAHKRSTGFVSFDIKKAFDSVWHDGLLFKLNKFKYPIYLIRIIQ